MISKCCVITLDDGWAHPERSKMAGATKKPATKKTVRHKDLKNALLSKGIRKLSNAKVMRLTGAWKFVKDPVEVTKAATSAFVTKATPSLIKKQIGGAKNGEEREVLLLEF